MKETTKTYYALCAVAAGLLFVGASGPLVQYMCEGLGATGGITPATSAVSTSGAGPATALYASLEGGCQSEQECRRISGKVPERSPEASTSPSSGVSSSSGPFCCIVEPTRAGPAAVLPGEKASEAVAVLAAAQAAFERPRPDRNTFSSSLAHRSRDAASPAGVSARVLTSVFLL